MLKYAEDGRSAWFSVDANGLEAAVQATLSGDAAALRQSGGDPLPFALAALRGRRPRSLAGAGRAPVRTAEGGGRAPAHGSRRGVGAARCRCGTRLVVSRAGDRRDLCPFRGAGRGELPHVRQRRLQPRCQGRSAARRRRAARRIDADGHRHGLPGEGAQSADRPGRPRRAFAQAGRRRPVAAGRPVRHRGPPRGEGGEHPGRRARQAVADLAAAHGRRLAARGHRLGAVPQAVAVAVLFPGRAAGRRGAQGHRHSTSSPACPSIATAACWSMPARSGPSRRCCWRRRSPRATSRSSNGGR